jgi:hypothetical protein
MTLEQLALVDAVRALLPQPVVEEATPGKFVFLAGEPTLVEVILSGRGVVVSMYGRRWTGSHTSERNCLELSRLAWKDLPASLPKQILVVKALVKAAVEIRRGQFFHCQYCKQRLPPERGGNDVCHSCAEKHLGIVH